MLRQVSKSAPNKYTQSSFRLFPWTSKIENTDFSNDGSLSSTSTIEDEEAQRGFDWETKYQRLPLKILGLWPVDNQFFSCLRFLVFWVIIFLYALPSVIGLGVTGFIGAVDTLRPNFAEVIPLIYTVVQFSVFRTQTSRIKMIVHTIYENWKDSVKLSAEEKKIMSMYSRKSRIVTVMFMGFYYSSCLGYFSEPLISMLIKGQPFMKKLANHGFHPFPTNISPNYEIVYVMQAFQGTSCAMAITSIDGFLLLSIFHGCGQLSLLCKTIYSFDGRIRHEPSLDINKKNDIGINCPCLKCIVDRHVSINHYLKIVDDIFHGIILARLMMNTAHFCGVGYAIVKSKESTNLPDIILNVLYMTTVTFNLFMYCWIGDRLLEEGENVGKSVYDLYWYNKEPKVAQLLMLPILQSRRPVKLTAGKFFVISFACFKEWFLKSMGYLSVLLAIKTQT